MPALIFFNERKNEKNYLMNAIQFSLFCYEYSESKRLIKFKSNQTTKRRNFGKRIRAKTSKKSLLRKQSQIIALHFTAVFFRKLGNNERHMLYENRSIAKNKDEIYLRGTYVEWEN